MDFGQQLRRSLGVPKPNFVSGKVVGPVRVILEGEERVADAVALGRRDRHGRYKIKYRKQNGRTHILFLDKWHVMWPEGMET